MQEKSAGAIVFNNGSILLLQHAHGDHWAYPKGHINANETEEQAAIREVKEETGIDIELLPSFKETESYFFTMRGKKVHKDVTVFAANAKNTHITPQAKEIRAAEWVPAAEAVKRATYEKTKEIIKKAITFHG